MTKDEALDLALEALEELQPDDAYPYSLQSKAITAIKQARALDKKAENARELGLDYEPADGTQVSKVWWDGEKLMAKPIPLEDIYQPAPKCTRSHPHENMDSMCELRTEIARLRNENERVHVENRRLIDRIETIDVPPAAQRQWVGLTDEEIDLFVNGRGNEDDDDYVEPTGDGFGLTDADLVELVRRAEAKLKERNT